MEIMGITSAALAFVKDNPGTAILALATLYLLLPTVYNLFLSPLHHVPGPLLWSLSPLPFSRSFVSGLHHRHMLALHTRYGPAVRVGPRKVMFASASSWKDIYGHTPGRGTFKKNSFYGAAPRGQPAGVNAIRDPAEHGRMRKMLSGAFSAKALGEQEVVVRTYVDRLVRKLGERGAGKEGVEVSEWFNWMTFDVVGDLSMGEPCHELEEEKPHFLLTTFYGAVRAALYASTLHDYMPELWMKMLHTHLLPPELLKQRQALLDYTVGLVRKRLALPYPRKDFLEKMAKENADANLTVEAVSIQASLLLVAGSETTATALIGLAYYLCTTPHAYAALTRELREAFSEPAEIDIHSTDRLPYLRAVIDEGLRIFSPAQMGFPRESPGEYVDGLWMPKGTEVATHMYATTHLEANFASPDEFIPERWLDREKFAGDNLAASQPFLLGTRVCLGRNLALLELRLVLSLMLWTYDMELVNKDIDWRSSLRGHLLWDKPKVFVRFTRRAGAGVEDTGKAQDGI